MEISARNARRAIVKLMAPGAVNAEMVMEVTPGLEITAVITNAATERLGLSIGGAAYAVVKASNVLVTVD
jgi:molybdopterin-binding protein